MPTNTLQSRSLTLACYWSQLCQPNSDYYYYYNCCMTLCPGLRSWCHCHPIMSASAKSRMACPARTDSPGKSQTKGLKTVVVVWWLSPDHCIQWQQWQTMYLSWRAEFDRDAVLPVDEIRLVMRSESERWPRASQMSCQPPAHSKYTADTNTHTTVLQPFVWDYPGEPVPEETFIHSYPPAHQPSSSASSIYHKPQLL